MCDYRRTSDSEQMRATNCGSIGAEPECGDNRDYACARGGMQERYTSVREAREDNTMCARRDMRGVQEHYTSVREARGDSTMRAGKEATPCATTEQVRATICGSIGAESAATTLCLCARRNLCRMLISSRRKGNSNLEPGL